MKKTKEEQRIARHSRGRKKVAGIAECPRLVVHRSLKNLQLQLVDDTQARTMLSLSTLAGEIKGMVPYGGNVKAAIVLGEAFAKLALSKGVKKIVFDRNGYAYHGRIKALAEALRKGGLAF